MAVSVLSYGCVRNMYDNQETKLPVYLMVINIVQRERSNDFLLELATNSKNSVQQQHDFRGERTVHIFFIVYSDKLFFHSRFFIWKLQIYKKFILYYFLLPHKLL